LQLAGRAAFAGTVASIGNPAIAQQAERSLRYTSLFPPGHPDPVSSDFFAEQVAKYTKGKLRIQVFHNGALGGDLEAAQGIKNGTIDMGRAGSAGFGTFMRDIRVFELPYLYKNPDELKRVVDRAAPLLEPLFLENGIKILGYQFDGPRMTLANKPLKTFADLKGVRYRVPQSPIYVNMVKAFGAVPTPVSLPELYTALQAKVADALEGSASALYNGKYYEVAKFLLRTDHICNPSFVTINAALFSKLSHDEQKALLDAGRDETDFNLARTKEANVTDLDRLLKAGVTEAKPDLAPFETATRKSSEEYVKSLGGRAPEFYNLVKDVLKT
jgi:tripartite ATP-independent transporter DctP family solute receptor